MNSNRTILFLSHGGGPLPLLGDVGHTDMVECLQHISTKIAKPKAIIVISAHWEQIQAAITASSQPDLIYDYSGFPAESYAITYPAVGNPQLAKMLHTALTNNGINAVLDDNRGFDHGLFVPLKILYPNADVPCIQLSLINNLDPQAHINLGNALAKLDYDDLLIIGSGFSFHNMRAFFSPVTDETESKNTAFESWLIDTCSNLDLTESDRTQRLINWQQAPSARYCHPREEHLLPLHVCYGASQRACDDVFELTILGRKSSSYLWQS